MKAVLVFSSYVKEQKENNEVGAPVIPFRKVLKGALPQRVLVDRQNTQLGQEKHGRQMMMLITVLVNSSNFGKSGNRET